MRKNQYVVGVMVVFLLVATMAVSAQSNPSDRGETNVTFTAPDGTELHGYGVIPEGDGPFPGVLMIHEWWGLNVDTTRLADVLAAEGFVVLAPDAFRGSLAKTPQEAMAQLRSTPADQIAGDLDAALAFLMNHDAVDAHRVATMGFCFGGTQSMYLGTRAEGLSAVITLYGSGPIQSADELGNLTENGPVLGIFGAEDGSIPLREVRGFEAALNESNIENTITVYDGVGHAFVKSTTYDQGGAAQAAAEQVIAFLKETL